MNTNDVPEIQMETVDFLILSLGYQIRVKLPAPIDDMHEQYIGDFLMLFGKYSSDSHSIILEGLQKCDSALKAKIGIFISQHIKHDRNLKEIGRFLKKLDQNEWIAILPNNADAGLLEETKYALFEKNNKTYNRELHKAIGEKKNSLEENYTLKVFDEKSDPVGEPQKEKRICLFCGGSKATGATFEQIAHSVPESIGNKHLISYEECDDCNQAAGKSVDSSLGNFWIFERVLYNIVGKNGVPVLKSGEIFNLKRDGDNLVIGRFIKETDDPSSELNIEINYPGKIRLQDIYRCFAKSTIALAGHPQNHIFGFTKEWIKSVTSLDKLPKVGVFFHPSIVRNHPMVAIYIRHSISTSLPSVIFELQFAAFTITAIIPTSSDEASFFADERHFDVYWESMIHYNQTTKWVFHDYSDNTERKIVKVINMEQR